MCSSYVFQMLSLYCLPPMYQVLFGPLAFGFVVAIGPGVPPV